ncbi:MAG: hypothetical protein IJH34_12325, partial [Romboutsia sp.]|nr:hypothetical protein [Romboutsia sp.]
MLSIMLCIIIVTKNINLSSNPSIVDKPINNKVATKKVESILNKKENDEQIKNIINQIQEATKNVKNQDELEKIIIEDNIIEVTNEYSVPHETIREIYKIKGVKTTDNIYIKSIYCMLYDDMDDAIDTIKETTICKPIYRVTQGGPLPDKLVSIKGGWFLDIRIPVVDNSNILGEINVLLDITDIPGIPQNVERDELNDPIMLAKPVIYLYPQEKQDIKVKLDYDGELHTTYPKYNNEIKGWDVVAYPDSTIINKEDNLEYSYLFWDGYSESLNPNFEQGYVIKGDETHEFFQNILPKMGMIPREYNEFIVYWLPLMEKNEYNVISFLDDEYTDIAKLDITPKPDSLLRVFMVYKGIDSIEAKKIKATIKEPIIKPFERKGFTVIEWGGSKII